MRSDPRDQALQALYTRDLASQGVEHLDLSAKASQLVDGVTSHLAELDEALDRASDRWRVSRMAPVDRAVLRLALYELWYTSTPVGVVLSEAVRLAKRYSTEKSGAFVNGVLGRLARGDG